MADDKLAAAIARHADFQAAMRALSGQLAAERERQAAMIPPAPPAQPKGASQ